TTSAPFSSMNRASAAWSCGGAGSVWRPVICLASGSASMNVKAGERPKWGLRRPSGRTGRAKRMLIPLSLEMMVAGCFGRLEEAAHRVAHRTRGAVAHADEPVLKRPVGGRPVGTGQQHVHPV